MKVLPGSRALIALVISSSLILCADAARAQQERNRGDASLTMHATAGSTATWRIRRDEHLGTVAALIPPEGTRLLGASDEARSGEAWFDLNRKELGLSEKGGLRFVRRIEGARTRHLFYEQTYDGLPVEGGSYTVSLLADGRVRLILGRIVPITRMVNHPTLDRSAAGRFATRAVVGGLGETRVEESDRVLVRDGEGRYAVRVTVPVAHGSAQTVDIDAETGELLETLGSYDLMTGTGDGYDFNPTGPLVTHDLPRLLEPGDHLIGQFVDVRNSDGPNVTGSNGQFIFAATDTEMVAQPNAYYHIDRLVNYLRSIGWAGPTAPIVANVNTVDTNEGEFNPNDQSVNYHKQTPGIGNAALDADVIAHEVGHYVAYSLGLRSVGLFATSLEPNAVQEGLAHYFAGTYTNNPILYQWAFGCSVSPFVPLARLDTDKSVYNYSHYNNVNACGMAYGDPHANGLILAGALWDLRGYVGAAKADAILLKALPYCQGTPDFGCVFDAIFQADADYFNFEDEMSVLHSQLDRGIRCIPIVTMSGSTLAYVGLVSEFSASMKCQARPTSFTWFTRHYCAGVPCEDWQEVGWDPSFYLTESTAGSLDVKVVSLDDGGRSDDDTKHVTVYYPLTVSVDGPDQLAACELGHYCATVSGHGPFTYQWVRAGSNLPGATGTCADIGYDQDFLVQAMVTDADGQSKSGPRHVTVTGFCPPDLTGKHGVEFVRVDRASGAGRLGVVLSSGTATEAEVSLFDVAGRRIGASWKGTLRPGTQRVDLGAGAAGQSVYFYRIVANGAVRKGSAVVLR